MVRFFVAAVALLQLLSDVPTTNGWNLPGVPISQKEAIRMSTRRDTIMMPTQTPMVPFKPKGSDYAQFIDIFSAMYRDRTMMISRYLDEEAANNIISTMLYLRKEDPKGDIRMYFNVPGGQLRPALAIYDLMEQTKANGCEIETVNLAMCVGMGAFLCGAGTKGKRNAMPNARFLLQRTGMDKVFRGQASDIGLEVKNVKTWNDRMEGELSKMTGQPLSRIQQDLKRDFYLSSDEAVRYGLIDRVLLPSKLRRSESKGVDLGAFEGDDDQRYQKQENKGGWGSRQKPSTGPATKQDNNDDDDPPPMKG